MKITATLAIVFLIFTACNKITPCKLKGEWEVSSLNRAYSDLPQNFGAHFYDTLRYENGVGYYYLGNPIYSQWGYRNYSEFSYEFDKDGTFKIKTNYSYQYGNPQDKTVTVSKIERGSWRIMGKNKAEEIKAKTRIQLNFINYDISTVTDSLGIIIGNTSENGQYNGENYSTFKVESVSNNELILVEEYSYNGQDEFGFDKTENKYQRIVLIKN